MPAVASPSGDEVLTRLGALLTGASPVIDNLTEANAVAAALVTRHPPTTIEGRLQETPHGIPTLYATLSRVLRDGEPSMREQVAGYLAAVARARADRLAKQGTWTASDINLLLAMLIVDPRRFEAEARFRDTQLERMAATFAAPATDEKTHRVRDDLLAALADRRVVSFDAHERVARTWGRIGRLSAERRVDVTEADRATMHLPPPLAPLDASMYVLPSTVIDAEAAVTFLRGVRGIAPERTLIILADRIQRDRLAPHVETLRLTVLPTFDRGFSPWPRDPLTVLTGQRDAGAAADRLGYEAEHGEGVVIAVRPNTQRGREADAVLGQVLVQSLPADLDQRWGGLRWHPSPIPFHNGQMLDTGDAVWVSLHSLEPRILALRGLDRVPVSAFGTEEGRGYIETARRAADELATLYGRPVRFIHTLPETNAPADDEAAARDRVVTLHALGGGAGFDLDSLVTLLPGTEQGLIAFVGGIEQGLRLLDDASVPELDALSSAYALAARGEALRLMLATSARLPRARALEIFLDQIERHLTAEGIAVTRLPLYLVPRSLRRIREVDTDPDFLIGWHNVVLAREGTQRRAEGFVGHFAPGDRLARSHYREAGYRLDLVPSLIASVVRNGGYRCASQHLRRPHANRPPQGGGVSR